MSTAAPPPSKLDLADGPGEPGAGRGRGVAPWIAAAAAVGVTLLVAGGLALGGRGPLAGVVGAGPHVLNIGRAPSGATEVVTDGGGLRAGRYVLTGALPESPGSGTAWRLDGGRVDAQQVAALAGVLGLTGDPRRDGADWVVRGGAAVLRVYDAPGLPFGFDATPDDGSCPSIPTDGYLGPDTAVGCVVTAPPQDTTPPPGPDEAALGDLGRSLATALGADASVAVWTGMPYGGVTLDPTVDGVPTYGLATSLQVSTDGVLAASGWLAGLTGAGLDRGDDYPLRPAEDVFGDLAAMPQPALACAEEMDGPMCGGDVTVTGAAYGLTLAYDDGNPVLVPAWLFTVEGSDTPLALVAVESRYLGDPGGQGPGGGSGGSGGASTPGSTGSGGTEPGPAPDTPVEVGEDPAAPTLTP